MVDVFDAMTQARAYHNPIRAEEALRLMEGWYDTGYMGILKNYIMKEGLLKRKCQSFFHRRKNKSNQR